MNTSTGAVSVTGPHQRIVVQVPPRPVRPFAVAVAGAAGPILALALALAKTILGPGDATGAVGAVIALLTGLLAVFAIAELVSTYPGDEGLLLPLLRAYSPRVAIVAWSAGVVAALAVAGAALIAATTHVLPGGTPRGSLVPLATGAIALGIAWASSRLTAVRAHLVLAGTLVVVGGGALGVSLVDVWESTRFVASLTPLPGMPPLGMATSAAIGVLAPLVFLEAAAQRAAATGRPAYVATRATAGVGFLALLYAAIGWVLRGGLPPHADQAGGAATVIVALLFGYVGIRGLRLAMRLLERLVERRWLAPIIARLVPLVALALIALALRLAPIIAARVLLGTASFALLIFFALVFVALARLRRLDPEAPRQMRGGLTVRSRTLTAPVGLLGVVTLGACVLVALPLGAALALGGITITLTLFFIATPARLPDESRENSHYELLKRAGEPILAQQYKAAMQRERA